MGLLQMLRAEAQAAHIALGNHRDSFFAYLVSHGVWYHIHNQGNVNGYFKQGVHLADSLGSGYIEREYPRDNYLKKSYGEEFDAFP